MRRIAVLFLFVMVISPPLVHPGGVAQERDIARGLDTSEEFTISAEQLTESFQGQLEGPLDATDVTSANHWVSSLGLAEWLGPLAPVALSPFFGVTCLSGLSLWGPDWVTDNAMIGTSSVLRSQMLFFIFLLLTILTSVPRFTKVSKPLAQAVDRLETYSVIVILLAVKFAAASQGSGGDSVAMIHLGVVSFTLDTLLAIAMIINVLVINSVKFFFEFMVWLTPVPLLDAVFEVCNKSVCAALIAIYAFSPTLATVINLCVLFVALMVFRWVSRRVRFYRTMLLDPLISWLWHPYGRTDVAELIVFPKTPIGPFQAKSRLRLYGSDSDEGGWILQEASWWRPDRQVSISGDATALVRLGWVMHQIDFTQRDGTTLQVSFSRRYDGNQLQEIIEELRMQLSEEQAEETEAELRSEFA